MGVPRLDEEPRLADDLRKRRVPHRHDRAAVAHRLRHDDPERLERRVEREHVAGGEVRAERCAGDIAHEPGLLLDAQIAREHPQPGLLGAAPADDERRRHVGVETGSQRAQQHVHPLLRREPLEREDEDVRRRHVQGAADVGPVAGGRRDLDAVVHDATAPASSAVQRLAEEGMGEAVAPDVRRASHALHDSCIQLLDDFGDAR